MKKYLALAILLNILNFAAYADETSAANPASSVNDTIVELTEYEQLLRDKIVSYWGQDSRFLTHAHEDLLLIGCGISRVRRPDSYDRTIHPDCKQVLEFLKTYAQQIDKLGAEAQELRHQICKSFDTRAQQRLADLERK